MSTNYCGHFWASGLAFALLLPGCNSKPAAPVASTGGSETAVTAEAELKEEAEIEANLAKLSVEDRTLAEKQKICPVSGSRLGSASMGVPEKLDVKGHDVFICCEHCEEPLLKDPDKYLAKLGLAE